MFLKHHAEPSISLLGHGLMIAEDGGQTVSESGLSGGAPPLPAALLSAAVGDLDVIERLRKHVHQVRIPEWLCSSCGMSWPCETARHDLLVDLGWSKLAIYCSVVMERAARDLQAMSPRLLWLRFLEWTEPPEGMQKAYSNKFYNGTS